MLSAHEEKWIISAVKFIYNKLDTMLINDSGMRYFSGVISKSGNQD
jgi:hypothetical protein